MLANSLQDMLTYEEDDLEDVFMQTFRIGYTDVFGANLTHDLKTDGDKISVTKENREVRTFAEQLCI